MSRSSCVLVGVAVLALVAVCTTTWAQKGMSGSAAGVGSGGGLASEDPTSIRYLLRNEQVQADLKLTDEQKAKIKQAVRKADLASQALYPKMNDRAPPKPENEKQLTERADKIVRILNDEDAALAAVLDEGQTKRLKEIRLQADSRALCGPHVQEELGLTDEQKERIKVIAAEAQHKILFDGRETDPQQKIAKFRANPKSLQKDFTDRLQRMQEIEAKSETAMENVLTAEQKEKFEKMKGKKLDVGALRGGTLGRF